MNKLQIFEALCVIFLTSSVVLAETNEGTREEQIRKNSVGVGVADKEIEKDKQNKVDNTSANQFNDALGFLNNMAANQSARDSAKAAQKQIEYDNLESAYSKVPPLLRSNVESRSPLEGKFPNEEQDAYIVLEYGIKTWDDSKNRYKQFTYDISRNKFLVGYYGRVVYEPDPKKALKNLINLLEEDEDHHKDKPEDTDWPSYSGEIANYIGEIYFRGKHFEKSEVKQDFSKAREYFERSIFYAPEIDKNLDFASSEFIVESYFRLIEIYSLGIGVDKNPTKAQELAKAVAELTDAKKIGYLLKPSPEWEQVKVLVEPFLKKEAPAVVPSPTPSPVLPTQIKENVKVPKK